MDSIGSMFPSGGVGAADQIIPAGSRFPGDPGSGGIFGGGGPSSGGSSGGGIFANFPAPTSTGQTGDVATNPGTIFSGTGMQAPGPDQGSSPLAWLGNAAKAGGGIMGLVNMFRTSPTEKALEKGQKLSMQNASGLSGAGNQQLQQYIQGRLSPAQQAAVDQFKKEDLAKYRQYFANAGIPESTAMMDAEAKVNQDTAQYANQLLQQNFSNSIQSLGLANNTLAQQAYANLAQEKEIADSQAAAMQAIGQLAGLLG